MMNVSDIPKRIFGFRFIIRKPKKPSKDISNIHLFVEFLELYSF